MKIRYKLVTPYGDTIDKLPPGKYHVIGPKELTVDEDGNITIVMAIRYGN